MPKELLEYVYIVGGRYFCSLYNSPSCVKASSDSRKAASFVVGGFESISRYISSALMTSPALLASVAASKRLWVSIV